MKMEPKTVREIMPEDFTMILAKELRVDPANISRVVKLEKTNSKYWPAIERLAMATDSKAYKQRLAFLEKNYPSPVKAVA
ncbi:hypothetical protein [Adhaeribacter aquaticus]|uniref:hypothetical protein n=1 Tax=Adhaeribacter aquaticus TaxID=299567 RepID=UPI00041AAB33|nr:hypothetical protein [Adhaeribacter aquaticus]